MLNSELIAHNWERINNQAKQAALDINRKLDDVLVLAVSKTNPIESIIDAMSIGISHFGENYAQELRDKQQEIINRHATQPKWHFIGHLQTNKVKYIAPYVEMIHSVDSLKLAQEISKEARKNNRTIDILLQVNTSAEESKSGCTPNEVFELAEKVFQLDSINIRGLMTIGSFADDANIALSEFRLLRSLRDKLQTLHPNQHLPHLSMGMTNDFEVAIREGATIVRVGTAIFGSRYYPNA